MVKTPVFLALLLICLIFPAGVSAFQNETDFCFDKAGKAYGINPQLLKSLAKAESGLDPKAINRNTNGTVDMGLMQINSAWIKKLGLDPAKLLSDPCYNTMVGARILNYCIDSYGYTWKAIGCYNAASNSKRVDYSWKIFNELKKAPIANAAKEQKQGPAPSSLFFRVRDTSGEAR